MDISSIANSIVETQTTPAVSADLEDTTTDIPADQMGSRLAILAKKEKALREQGSGYAQKLKELEEREAKLSKYQGFDDVNDDNAIDFLKNKGLSLEKLQEKWLSQLSDEDVDPIQKQIKDLNAKLLAKDSEMEKLLEDRLSKRDSDAKAREIDEQSKYYNQELKTFLEENAETYDLIKTFDAAEEVFKVIKDVYLKTADTGTPKLLKFDEAAELYEGKLADLVKTMSSSKKVQSLLGKEADQDPFAQLTGQNTIDSSFNQSSSHSPDLKSAAEREKAAAKLFESMIARPS